MSGTWSAGSWATVCVCVGCATGTNLDGEDLGGLLGVGGNTSMDAAAGGAPFAPPVGSAGPTGGLGGSGPSGGASAGGSVAGDEGGASGDCGDGLKQCGGLCVSPSPAIGCDLTGCAPCPAPPDGAQSLCVSGMCDIACLDGYVITASGDFCVPEGAGGAGAETGDAGGTPDGGAGGVATGGAGGTPAGGAGGAPTGGAGGAPTGGTGGAPGGSGGTPASCDPNGCPSCFISGILGVSCCKPDDTCGCRAVLGILTCN